MLALLLALLLSATADAQSADLAARNRAAAQALGEGRFDEAATIYRDMLTVLPDEPGLLMNLGMALARGRHEAEAIAPLERAIALQANLVPAHAFLGFSYLALGKPEKAVAPLERVAAARPADVESLGRLAAAYAASGRRADAVTALRRVTALAPRLASGWYLLGQAYNAIKQDALDSFTDPLDGSWRQLLGADALLAHGQLIDAFTLYRATLERLPSMVSIHDAIARIYEQTGHTAWAVRERARGTLSAAGCASRKALCEFRGGRYRSALTVALAPSDPESRYWRARAANELALAAFKRLDMLADSPERRAVRASVARAEERYTDAVTELGAALTFRPGDPALIDELASSYYAARDYEKALATLSPRLQAQPDDLRLLKMAGSSLLQLRRLDEALPLLQRVVERDLTDPGPRLELGRAYLQNGDFAAAISLIEAQLAVDQDGSLHVQLARAYNGLGQRDRAAALLAESQDLQGADQERSVKAAQRTITAPK